MGQVLALAFVLLLFGLGTRGFFLSPKNLSTILSLAGIPLIICLAIHQVLLIAKNERAALAAVKRG